MYVSLHVKWKSTGIRNGNFSPESTVLLGHLYRHRGQRRLVMRWIRAKTKSVRCCWISKWKEFVSIIYFRTFKLISEVSVYFRWKDFREYQKANACIAKINIYWISMCVRCKWQSCFNANGTRAQNNADWDNMRKKIPLRGAVIISCELNLCYDIEQSEKFSSKRGARWSNHEKDHCIVKSKGRSWKNDNCR